MTRRMYNQELCLNLLVLISFFHRLAVNDEPRFLCPISSLHKLSIEEKGEDPRQNMPISPLIPVLV
jgi:hypothetical protein